MKTLEQFIKDSLEDKIIFEEYIYRKEDISKHALSEIKFGKKSSGSTGLSLDEMCDMVRQCDSTIENFMLNDVKNTKDEIFVGITKKDKNGFISEILGRLFDFNYDNCKYHFFFINDNKYPIKSKYEFHNKNGIIINLILHIENDKVKVIKTEL